MGIKVLKKKGDHVEKGGGGPTPCPPPPPQSALGNARVKSDV